MAIRATARAILLAAAAASAGTPAVAQQAAPQGQPLGAVRGQVYDSTAQGPLVDAAVFLWRTPYRTATDEDGRFLLADVPPGDYTLLFFHTRLGEMGVSPGPTPVRVAAGQTVEVALGTPSPFTAVVSECLYQEAEAGTGAIAGWIGDGETGMGLPRARVTLSWQPDGGGELERVHLEADAGGWYRACRAPAGLPITVSARFLDRQSFRREVTVEAGAAVEAGLLLWELDPTQVAGRLVDALSGEPVTDAEVWLRGTSFRRITAQDGRFQLGAVPPGTYMMLARHLGYGTKQDTLEIPSGQTISVEMRLDTEPIEIAPITVTVEARPISERAMGGLTIDRAAIDEVRGRVRDVADILQTQHIPGVIVRRRGDGSLCVGSMPGQVRMMFNTGCVPMVVFINNVRATNPEMALQLPPDAVERIVLYRPVEAGALFGLGSGNGVMVIFTRNR